MAVAPHQLEGNKRTKIFQELGVTLRKGRESAGLTQREVADDLGYSSPQFVSNIERGLCAPPLNVLRFMIEAYGLSPNKILKFLIDSHSELFRSALMPQQKSGKRRAKRA